MADDITLLHMTLLQEGAYALRLPAECMQLSQKQLSRMHAAAAISCAANSLNVLSQHQQLPCKSLARLQHMHARLAPSPFCRFSLTSAEIRRVKTTYIQISRGLCELQAIHLLPRYSPVPERVALHLLHRNQAAAALRTPLKAFKICISTLFRLYLLPTKNH
jgi:hypothetical protein